MWVKEHKDKTEFIYSGEIDEEIKKNTWQNKKIW